MALPVAHGAVALALTRDRDYFFLLTLALLSILPDGDFILVWGWGWEMGPHHRTFSHSLLFFAGLTLLWIFVRPRRLGSVSAPLFFAVLCSHSLLDLLCTADVSHGVMLFWPLLDWRLGWPVLVPLYQAFALSPFSLHGAVNFTLLEMALALPLWMCSRGLSAPFHR